MREDIGKELRSYWQGQYSAFNSFTIGSKQCGKYKQCNIARNNPVCLPSDIDYGWQRLKDTSVLLMPVMRLVEAMNPS
jgi:hypothetical protein